MLWSELCHVLALIALKRVKFFGETCCDGWEKHSVAKKQNKKATKSEECIPAEQENIIEDVHERDGSAEEDNGNP